MDGERILGHAATILKQVSDAYTQSALALIPPSTLWTSGLTRSTSSESGGDE